MTKGEGGRVRSETLKRGGGDAGFVWKLEGSLPYRNGWSSFVLPVMWGMGVFDNLEVT